MEPTSFAEIGGALVRGVVAGLAARGALSLIPDGDAKKESGNLDRFISPELKAASAEVQARMAVLGIHSGSEETEPFGSPELEAVRQEVKTRMQALGLTSGD